MTTAVCVHHYVCTPANGPTSVGVCKHCGLTRTFRNSDTEETLTERHGKRGGAVSKAQKSEFYADISTSPGWFWS